MVKILFNGELAAKGKKSIQTQKQFGCLLEKFAMLLEHLWDCLLSLPVLLPKLNEGHCFAFFRLVRSAELKVGP